MVWTCRCLILLSSSPLFFFYLYPMSLVISDSLLLVVVLLVLQLLLELLDVGLGCFFLRDLGSHNIEDLVVLLDGSDPSAESACDYRFLHQDLRQEVVLLCVGLNPLHGGLGHVVLVEFDDALQKLGVGHLLLDRSPVGIGLAEHSHDGGHDVHDVLGRVRVSPHLTDISFG